MTTHGRFTQRQRSQLMFLILKYGVNERNFWQLYNRRVAILNDASNITEFLRERIKTIKYTNAFDYQRQYNRIYPPRAINAIKIMYKKSILTKQPENYFQFGVIVAYRRLAKKFAKTYIVTQNAQIYRFEAINGVRHGKFEVGFDTKTSRPNYAVNYIAGRAEWAYSDIGILPLI